MTPAGVSLASLWARTAELLRAHIITCAVWLLILTVGGVVADTSWQRNEDFSNFVNLATICAVTVGQYSVTRRAVLGHVPPGQRPASFARFFLLTIITGLGLILGFLALLIPGIVLGVRWSAAVPALIARDLTIGEAISASWHVTKPHFWPILGLFLIIWAPTLAVLVVDAVAGASISDLSYFLVLNLAMNSSMIVVWLAAVAVHNAVSRDPRIEEVFA